MTIRPKPTKYSTNEEIMKEKLDTGCRSNNRLFDPHSPSEYRVIGIMPNMPEYYTAFNVNEGDKLYFSENERVKIW